MTDTGHESIRGADRPASARARPGVEPAALDLIRRYGRLIFGTARRYSLTPEDAEDAYQRSLEILLTKAPSTDERELVPWLKTVVKHEAFATRRQREQAEASGDEGLERAAGSTPSPHEQAERYERLQLGAEAIRRLKPQEVRCLLLRAEGYSYKQICQATGWTYTKVNRCLTEGRRNFLANVARIEAGTECERLAPLLSALADGEATSHDLLTLRPHLRTCLMCRATLRRFRAVPGSVSALVPPAAAAGGADVPGVLHRGLDSVASWFQERGMTAGLKVQQAIEMATTSKAAAVTASTVALAGGGIATVSSLEHEAGRPGERAARHEARHSPDLPRTPPTRAVAPLPRETESPPEAPPATVAASPADARQGAAAPPPPEPAPAAPAGSSGPQEPKRRQPPPEPPAREEPSGGQTTSDGDFGL